MGLFDKFKTILSGKKDKVEEIKNNVNVDDINDIEVEDIKDSKEADLVSYDKGLEKTRKEFVSQLSILGKKFTKVNEDYYEEGKYI